MRILIVALILAAASGACYRPGSGGGADAAPTFVKVQNQSFDDMNIFVLPEGETRIRLGTATGKTDHVFVIPGRVVPYLRPLRFLATPIATQRGPVSEQITVSPGDTVVLTIPPA
jgi:hypothetical protein